MTGFFGLKSRQSATDLYLKRIEYADARWSQVVLLGLSILVFISIFRISENLAPSLLRGFYTHRHERLKRWRENKIAWETRAVRRHKGHVRSLSNDVSLGENREILAQYIPDTAVSNPVPPDESEKRRKVLQPVLLHFYISEIFFAIMSIISGYYFKRLPNLASLHHMSPRESFPQWCQHYFSVAFG